MERRGKAEGIRIDNGGRVCALGALQIATGERGTRDDNLYGYREAPRFVVEPLAKFCRPDDGEPYSGIAGWSNTNDAPTVIAGMRAVAATLRAQERVAVAPETVAA